MKYQHLVSLALAAALLLTGCGGTQSSLSAAADQSSDSSQNTPALTAQKERVTDQFTLEKNALSVWEDGTVQHFSVHVPKLECTSPDAVSLNKELNAIYAADFREYETCEEAELPDGEAPQIGVGWDAYWYGD